MVLIWRVYRLVYYRDEWGTVAVAHLIRKEKHLGVAPRISIRVDFLTNRGSDQRIVVVYRELGDLRFFLVLVPFGRVVVAYLMGDWAPDRFNLQAL